MQFSLIAHDFKDDDALNRRMACRELHLAGIRRMAEAGEFLSGGAILDDDGRMVGSSVHVAFASRAALDNWLQHEPYVTERVWDQIEIREVRLVDLGA